MWSKMQKDTPPVAKDIELYINSPYWQEFQNFITTNYQAKPKYEYSGCSIPGWNIKYRKSGRALCTVYPMEGYFTVLVVIMESRQEEFEQLLPSLHSEIKRIYQNTEFGIGQKWLLIDVTNQSILEDVKKCIQFRLLK